MCATVVRRFAPISARHTTWPRKKVVDSQNWNILFWSLTLKIRKDVSWRNETNCESRYNGLWLVCSKVTVVSPAVTLKSVTWSNRSTLQCHALTISCWMAITLIVNCAAHTAATMCSVNMVKLEYFKWDRNPGMLLCMWLYWPGLVNTIQVQSTFRWWLTQRALAQLAHPKSFCFSKKRSKCTFKIHFCACHF